MKKPNTDDIEYLRSLGLGLTFTEPLPLSEVDRFQRAACSLLGKEVADLLMTAGDGKAIRFGVQVKP